MDLIIERRQFDICGHGATGGPKMEIALRRLSDSVRASGDTVITGSLVIQRNRHRGQFRPGWMATCEAIRDGQANGFGLEYSIMKWHHEYVRPEQLKFHLPSPPKKDT